MIEDKKEIELILAIVNDGFSGELIKYAKSVCEVRATLLKARGTSRDEVGEIAGQSIYKEKELVMLTVEKKNKKAVMEKICAHFGLDSDAQAVVFSIALANYFEYGKDDLKCDLDKAKQEQNEQSENDSVQEEHVEQAQNNDIE